MNIGDFMVKSKGKRSETRQKLRKNIRDRGKPPIKNITQDFTEGKMVSISINPSVPEGQPHPRFHGNVGTICGKQGRAYIINIREGGKTKRVISRPEHLIRVEK